MAERKHTAIVTGASRGIGAAIASRFRTQGIEVIAPSRQELDLSSTESIRRYLGSLSGKAIDILVNNAGINLPQSISDLTDENWELMIQTNLTAPMKLIQGVLPHMKKSGWGRVLNVSSVFSVVTKENRAAYSATKSGLNGLTRTLAVELGSSGILVNALCPGYVDTELTHQNNSAADLEKIRATIPLGRLATVDEMARLAAFLCSEENTYLTGQMIIADGGFSCK